MILNHVYLEGKQVKHVDMCIEALFEYMRDKQFDQIIKLHKGKHGKAELVEHHR